MRLRAGWAVAALGFLGAGCATAGSAWINEPMPGTEEESAERAGTGTESARPHSVRRETQVLGAEETSPREVAERAPPAKLEGRVLAGFRNTYYDFPNERDFTGDLVSVKDAHCKTVRQVPRPFFEAICVQGSGTLASGSTVSFAKRDCDCAEVCPRTQQQICFEELDARRFPWGRGASGGPITPLLSVAVDSDVIPLSTPIYIPEFDGLPRDESRTSFHDGCFIAQDRGLRVKGKHVDVFTGDAAVTRLWNQLVPSNRGVTVVLESPRCARATDVKSLAAER